MGHVRTVNEEHGALPGLMLAARAGPRMRDAGIDKWIALEMGRMREGLVLAPRPLGDLLLEDRPTAPTRGGGAHSFDKAVLERLAAHVGAFDRRRLRLPITFYVEHETPDDAYVQDEAAWRLLVALGDVSSDVAPREGRLWLGHARARAIAARHPTVFQFVQL